MAGRLPLPNRAARMQSKSLQELIALLQVAIGPVILFSGVGLLLLTLTNRFGRAVDRSRLLARELREICDGDPARLRAQVEILFRRARWIRLAITLAAVSLLLAGILIIALFLAALLEFEVAPLISLLFISCMASLVVALVAFIVEIHLSLVALKLELSGAHAISSPGTGK